MPAIISVFDRINRAIQFKTDPIFMGLSGVTPWADENAPPTPVGDLTENYEFFDECFAVKKVTEFTHVIPDPTTYADITQASGYIFVAVDDTTDWVVGDQVIEQGDVSGKFGYVRHILGTGGDSIVGATPELAIEMLNGVFSPGATIENGTVSATAVVLRIGEKRILYRDNFWKESHVDDLVLRIEGSIAALSIGDTIEDNADSNVVGRILAIDTQVIGSVTQNFVVIQVTGNSWDTTTDINKIGDGNVYSLAEKISKIYYEGGNYLFFSVDFPTSSIPTDATYRKVAVVIDPQIVIGTPLTGNQYDEQTDGGSSGWGTNGWYMAKFAQLGTPQFIEYRKPIARAADQSETLKAIVRF